YYESDGDALRRLWRHAAEAVVGKQPFDTEHFRLRDPRYVPVGDLQRRPIDDAVVHRPAEEAVVGIDLGEPVREAALDLADLLAHGAFRASAAAALRRIPPRPGRSNGVSPYRRGDAAPARPGELCGCRARGFVARRNDRAGGSRGEAAFHGRP